MQVNGVCSNVTAFYELLGGREFILAVKSDLNVARDLMCKMIPMPPEIAKVRCDEMPGGGSALCDEIANVTPYLCWG